MKKFREWLNEEDNFALATQMADAKQRAKDAKTEDEKKFYEGKHNALKERLAGLKEESIKTKIGHALPSAVRSTLAASYAFGKKLGAETEKDKKKYDEMSKRFRKRTPPKFSFSESLNESKSTGASSVEEELLGHLTHAKDVGHEDPQHASMALDMMEEFHKMRQGLPSTAQPSLKHDGGSSVHIIRDKRGRLGVSDKHRFARGVVAYTPEDIDKHFGHQPSYAQALKHLLTHGRDIVGRGTHLQGDLLWTPGDPQARQRAGRTKYTPNRLTYEGQSKAPIGLAIHTQITNGVAHSPNPGSIGSSDKIFVPQYQYQPDPHNYSEEARNAVEHHLSKAREILQDHDTSHLTPDHIYNFTIYNNRATRRGETPSLEGYIRHLKDEGEKAASKMKTPIGQERKRGFFQNLARHAMENKEGFGRSIALRDHLQRATDYLVGGIEHPDLKTTLDGKPSLGEGLVLGRKDGKGLIRPALKLVHSGIQRALGNNPRFGRA